MKAEKRNEMIERLNRSMTETVMQWALSDYDSLLEFVKDAMEYNELSDDALIYAFETQLGEDVENDEQDEELPDS